MSSNPYSKYKGQHAPFSPSQPYWLRYDEQKLLEVYRSLKAAELGTRLHALAAEHIDMRISMPKNKKTLNAYVNDSIGMRMSPEEVVFYSPRFFGTADALRFDEKRAKLYINDLKTGRTKPHMEQLWIYAALFCLEKGIRPGDLEIITKLYFQDDVIEDNPTTEDIVGISDKIRSFDKVLEHEDES